MEENSFSNNNQQNLISDTVLAKNIQLKTNIDKHNNNTTQTKTNNNKNNTSDDINTLSNMKNSQLTGTPSLHLRTNSNSNAVDTDKNTQTQIHSSTNLPHNLHNHHPEITDSEIKLEALRNIHVHEDPDYTNISGKVVNSVNISNENDLLDNIQTRVKLCNRLTLHVDRNENRRRSISMPENHVLISKNVRDGVLNSILKILTLDSKFQTRVRL